MTLLKQERQSCMNTEASQTKKSVNNWRSSKRPHIQPQLRKKGIVLERTKEANEIIVP